MRSMRDSDSLQQGDADASNAKRQMTSPNIGVRTEIDNMSGRVVDHFCVQEYE